MSDAASLALERAQMQAGLQNDLLNGDGPEEPDADASDGVIRTPIGSTPTIADERDSGLISKAQEEQPDYTMATTAGLTDEQKQALLDELLKDHNEHTTIKRDLEIERDRIELENKRRFGKLGYHLGLWGMVVVFALLISLVGFLGYGMMFDKTLIDSGVFTAFLNTIVEVFKTIFGAF